MGLWRVGHDWTALWCTWRLESRNQGNYQHIFQIENYTETEAITQYVNWSPLSGTDTSFVEIERIDQILSKMEKQIATDIWRLFKICTNTHAGGGGKWLTKKETKFSSFHLFTMGLKIRRQWIDDYWFLEVRSQNCIFTLLNEATETLSSWSAKLIFSIYIAITLCVNIYKFKFNKRHKQTFHRWNVHGQ